MDEPNRVYRCLCCIDTCWDLGCNCGGDAITPQPAITAERLREVLREHWLSAMRCNEITHMDNAECACSLVHLGWHPSVGAAAESWIDHIIALVTAPAAAQDGGEATG